MLRVARGYVPSHEIAEEVVQETWIALRQGDRQVRGPIVACALGFSRVMINIAKARGVRERRDADAAIAAFTGGTVDPARFREAGDPYPGHWKPDEVPSPFPDTPEGSVLGRELVDVARRELDKLPERQRIVVTLRDMLGFDSSEVCELLDISVANQRVLLHRGRAAAVRQVLEDYLAEKRHEYRTRWTATNSSSWSRPTSTVRSTRTPGPASTCTCSDCDGCENYLQQFRETVRTVGKIRDDELDPAFRNRLLDAFKDFR